MSMTKQQILDEAKALDPKEREELFDDLRQFVGEDELTVEQWDDLRSRVDELHRGNVTLLDGEEVTRGLLDELRHKYVVPK